VAKVIEFYIPSNFRKSLKWFPPEQRGKIIEFASPVKNRPDTNKFASTKSKTSPVLVMSGEADYVLQVTTN
jgi:hypothetical protein